MKYLLSPLILLVTLVAVVPAQAELPFTVTEVAKGDEPWAVAVMPDGRLLVTEVKGTLFIVNEDGSQFRISYARRALRRSGRYGRCGPASRL